MSAIKEHISSKINSALNKLGFSITAFAIECPKEESHGDFSTNDDMMIAKQHKLNHRKLTQKVIYNLDMPYEIISSADIACPRFINFFVHDNYYKSELAKILNDKTEYG